MNPVKSKIKADVYESFGREMEEREKKVNAEIQQNVGAKDGLALAAKRIGDLNEHIRKDMEEGAIDVLAGEPLKIEAYAMKWVKRAIGVCDNLATAAEVARIQSIGKAKGLSETKDLIFKLWTNEQCMINAYLESLEKNPDGDVDGRSLDGHPGLSLKAVRKESDSQEKAKEKPKKTTKTKAKGKKKE